MSEARSPASFMAKAARSLQSARLLLKDKDTAGATNRAYYAMFDAAHAALFAAGRESTAAPIKTHDGLIGQFGKLLVQTGLLDAKFGRALNQVEDIRYQADYAAANPSTDDATWAIEQATAFLVAIRTAFPAIDGTA